MVANEAVSCPCVDKISNPNSHEELKLSERKKRKKKRREERRKEEMGNIVIAQVAKVMKKNLYIRLNDQSEGVRTVFP